ncbi:AAA family ATPase [Dactylosporangium sp. NPDC000244]|uniref:helix-turn-helix transcriptional regulator n=1 Tax=Dactylosporangium sp. NPDC000244 TaxID=3154365 RepID=UPI0033248607
MLLVERDEQLTRLGEAFRACTDGRGQVTLVSGPVGSGKTALLLAFARQAVNDGARVIGAGGSRAEHKFPFGIIGQLLHDAGLAPNSDAYAAVLKARCALAGSLGDPGSDGSVDDQVHLPYLQTISGAFAAMASEQPLVIAVDDLHYADLPSLHCLLYLIRRLRSTRIMVVLSESNRAQPTHVLFRTDILSQPHFSRVSLAPLSRRGVNQLIEASLEQPTAPELATACFDVSAGNPMLTRALIDDQVRAAREPDGQTTAELRIDDAFEQAVLSFLYRHDPSVLAVAQAVAVLGEPGSPQVLARMVDIVPENAAQILRVLESSGLLSTGRFRHPRARRALLNHLPAAERRALHRKAAELLQENGAAPGSVADHLVEAAYDDAAWVVPVLRDAARHALADSRPEHASAPLRLALRAARDDRQRVAARTALIGAEWQTNPLMVTRHLGDLLSGVRADPAHAGDALAALPYLLWHGRVDESVELLTAAADASGPAHVELASELRGARQLLASAFPARAASVACQNPDAATVSAAPRRRSPIRGFSEGSTCAEETAISAHLQPTTLLTAVLGNGSRADAIGAADHVLQRCSSQKTAPEPVAAALLALIYADRPDRCLAWCESLALARPAPSLPPAWQGVLKAIQAEGALRLGNLTLAERAATEALAIMPPAAWGFIIGGVLATLISATTEMGALDRAREHLATPVPQSLFGTPLGLHYLQARGRYYRATGRLQAALTDFRSCGELMSSWQLDLPTVVAWRLESARTYLALGRADHAVELAREQLRQLGPLDGRTRGATLRTIAATYAPEQRTTALDEAVDLLHGTGDRLELAHALADLGRTWQALGQSGRARLLIRRAHHISVECGAEPLSHSLSHDDPEAGLVVEAPKPGAGEVTLELLSDAERRVAALAVQGYTNREIASKLYVTVSTVEQHLTRVYRKVNVKRRADLPVGLAPPATVQSDPGMRAC